MEQVFSAEKPDAVNHHAAQIDVRRGVREPVFDASVNILGSITLLEAAVAHKVRRFVYISSAGATYGEPERLPVPETYPANPVTPYGISKHSVEHYLDMFSALYDLPFVVLRYGNVYGPRQSSKGEAGVFAIFCEQMISGIRPSIYGDGTKVRDYVYVEDVVRANVLALEHGTGEAFNIASGVRQPIMKCSRWCGVRWTSATLNRIMPQGGRVRWNGYTWISQRREGCSAGRPDILLKKVFAAQFSTTARFGKTKRKFSRKVIECVPSTGLLSNA